MRHFTRIVWKIQICEILVRQNYVGVYRFSKYRYTVTRKTGRPKLRSQMKETFEQNHNKTLTEEAEAQAMYEDLVAEKKKGIEVARERKNTKVMEVASALNEESRQGEGKM